MIASRLLRYFRLSAVADVSLTRYCIVAYLSIIVPATIVIGLLVALAHVIGFDPGTIQVGSAGSHGAWDIAGNTLVAPIGETFILGALVAGVRLWVTAYWRIALIVAVIMAGLHGLVTPLWFLGVIWPFVVLSIGFVVWRQKSYWHAYAAACVPHALNNFTVSTFVYFS